LPDGTTDVAVLRVVVREGFSLDLADSLVEALSEAVDHLTKNPPRASAASQGFSHT
jgi:glutamate decarboxylase